ncbi:MAG: hypothetical protein V4654_10615 [Bdellovibrionota bacterium]
MKKLISVLVLLFSVSVMAQVKTYHIEIKNWPDRRQIESQINELVDSKVCYDVNGAPANPPTECHRFAWFKSNEVLKPYKKRPTDIKMVLGYAGGEMKVTMFKWDGKKNQRILNSGSKMEPDIKNHILRWTFK